MGAVKGGDRVSRRLRELAERLDTGEILRAGFLEGATYPDGTSVPLVAAANEFGDPAMNRPPRAFFRDAIAANGKRWAKGLGKLIHAGNSTDKALALTGEVVRADIQDSIRKFATPPLSPNTRKKSATAGFDKPLIDTGHMLNSVDYEVRKDEPAGNSQ